MLLPFTILLCVFAGVSFAMRQTSFVYKSWNRHISEIPEGAACSRWQFELQWCSLLPALRIDATAAMDVARCTLLEELGNDCLDVVTGPFILRPSERYNVACLPPATPAHAKVTVWRAPTLQDLSNTTFTIDYDHLPGQARVWVGNGVLEQTKLSCKQKHSAVQDCAGIATCPKDDVTVTSIVPY